MSFYTMALLGGSRIGSLLGSVIADRFGARIILRVSRFGCLLGGAWVAYKLPGRPGCRPSESTASGAWGGWQPWISAARRGGLAGATDAYAQRATERRRDTEKTTLTSVPLNCLARRSERWLNYAELALVVGAGIGGLAAALALKRARWMAAASEGQVSAGELGFALLLAPNAMPRSERSGLNEGRSPRRRDCDQRRNAATDGTVLRRFDAAAAGGGARTPSASSVRCAWRAARCRRPGIVTLDSAVTGFTGEHDRVNVGWRKA